MTVRAVDTHSLTRADSRTTIFLSGIWSRAKNEELSAASRYFQRYTAIYFSAVGPLKKYQRETAVQSQRETGISSGKPQYRLSGKPL